MDFGRTGALLTIDEWDQLVAEGKVKEPPVSTTTQPRSGIGCYRVIRVNRDGSKKICMAHLLDLDRFVLSPDGELRMAMGCGVCGFVGKGSVILTRAIAK